MKGGGDFPVMDGVVQLLGKKTPGWCSCML